MLHVVLVTPCVLCLLKGRLHSVTYSVSFRSDEHDSVLA